MDATQIIKYDRKCQYVKWVWHSKLWGQFLKSSPSNPTATKWDYGWLFCGQDLDSSRSPSSSQILLYKKNILDTYPEDGNCNMNWNTQTCKVAEAWKPILCISPYIFWWLNVDIIFASLNYGYSATVVSPEHHFWFWISIHRAFQYNRIPLGCHCNPRCCYVWVVCNIKT